jgi:hypothetical protein
VDARNAPGEERFALVYGRAPHPSVHAVEVTFDDGRILRERPTNGVFAALAPGARAGLELHALRAGGELLRRLTLPYGPEPQGD